MEGQDEIQSTENIVKLLLQDRVFLNLFKYIFHVALSSEITRTVFRQYQPLTSAFSTSFV